MLRAYREGATTEKIGDNGEVVARSIPMKIPKRNVEKKHGEFEHDAVLLIMGAGDDEHAALFAETADAWQQWLTESLRFPAERRTDTDGEIGANGRFKLS